MAASAQILPSSILPSSTRMKTWRWRRKEGRERDKKARDVMRVDGEENGAIVPGLTLLIKPESQEVCCQSAVFFGFLSPNRTTNDYVVIIVMKIFFGVLGCIQRTAKKYANFAKQDPGQVEQLSKSRKSFLQPRTSFLADLCINPFKPRLTSYFK